MNTELQNPIVKWPFGKADVVSLTATGNQAVDIYNNLTSISYYIDRLILILL